MLSKPNMLKPILCTTEFRPNFLFFLSFFFSSYSNFFVFSVDFPNVDPLVQTNGVFIRMTGEWSLPKNIGDLINADLTVNSISILEDGMEILTEENVQGSLTSIEVDAIFKLYLGFPGRYQFDAGGASK